MDSMIPLGQNNTLAEYMILSGDDNRLPMLDKDLYDSWKSLMEFYMQNREHGRMILESVKNGSLIWPTVEENGVTRTKKYVELSAAEKIQADCDMKATNIILQGLPADIYSLVNHHRVAKDLWERVLPMQGTSLTKQERECKLYDAFDKFTHIKGETLHKYYLRFTQLINDMNIYNMKIEQFQVNTKFLNNLPLEWSKFVTDVKLVKDLHTTNFDQLHAYLEQHKLHANEVRLLCERISSTWQICITKSADDTTSLQHLSVFIQQSSTSTIVFTISVWINSSQSTLLIYLSITTSIQSSVPSSYPYHFAVPLFSLEDDPIACLNKAIAFLTVLSSSSYSGTGYKSNAPSSGGNNASGHARVVKCYNCQGEAHMARQCTQPKRPRNATWYKEKAMLAEAQEARKFLDEEQLAFLTDPRTEDLDTYDSDCNDILNAQAVLMENISNYGSDVISKVPHSKTYLNDVVNQGVQAMQDFEQPSAVDFTDNEIHNDSIIILYF
ncbi:retrovirus-related pol polyprotein from transposon TNT 1-94 [Tanacetum coccineum]|uniref:Retrovirus-related pol polyprotein from transposon TNT 1-94 n=1 Tax=Tanacetum coccineum TaxID=301880 RepID=A0ABQ5FIU1_9ASTR